MRAAVAGVFSRTKRNEMVVDFCAGAVEITDAGRHDEFAGQIICADVSEKRLANLKRA